MQNQSGTRIMNTEIVELAQNDQFTFSCSNKLKCFNNCCRDLNQFLTPYDICRLKNSLQMPSNFFLEKYTVMHTGPETGLPIISLKPKHASGLSCPFVSSSGCKVYKDRPSSCRMYPLARIVKRSRKSGKMIKQYMLLKESHCFGFSNKNRQTVSQWIKDQGLLPYNEINDMLMEIISLKNQLKPGHLDPELSYYFQMACYNLDVFRDQIFNKGLLSKFAMDDEISDKMRNDDELLLKFGLKWITKILFN